MTISRDGRGKGRWIGAALLLGAAFCPSLSGAHTARSALAAGPAEAAPFSALARVLPGSRVTQPSAKGDALLVTLDLSMPVPWRAAVLDDPWRLVLDFSDIDRRSVDAKALSLAGAIAGLKVSSSEPGWSRIEFLLPHQMHLQSAALRNLQDKGIARLEVSLLAPHEGAYPKPLAEIKNKDVPSAAAAQPRVGAGATISPAVGPALSRQDGTRPLRVALDPGHGGVDPGAERQGHREADLVLIFALELEEALLRAGIEVALTRRADEFVPLDARMTLARDFGADVLLSLHADTVLEGEAQGISLYTYSPSAGAVAAQLLAERHAGDDLISGLDLTGQDDEVTKLLMGLAQANTQPRSEALAEKLVAGFARSVGGLYRRPMQAKDFAVLKAPDIPSVLIELGYMSSLNDLNNLTDPDWRALAQAGIAAALLAWAEADASEARLIWQ